MQGLARRQDCYDFPRETYGWAEENDLPNKSGALFVRKRGRIKAE